MRLEQCCPGVTVICKRINEHIQIIIYVHISKPLAFNMSTETVLRPDKTMGIISLLQSEIVDDNDVADS